MLKEVLIWWTRQMRDLVPPRLRPSGTGLGRTLLLSIADGPPDLPAEVTVAERRGRRVTERLHLRLDALDHPPLRALLRLGLSVVLCPPPAVLLEREVTLPLAAEHELESVLGFEMDRFTPFTSAEVAWGFALRAREPTRGVVRVDLFLVPRAALHGILTALDQVDVAPTWLEFPRPDGTTRRLQLRRPNPVDEHWHRRALMFWAWCCAGLAVAAVAQPLFRQSIDLARTDRKIAALVPLVHEAQTLRRRIRGSATGADAVAGERIRIGNALSILAAVTQVLPDNTYLTEFRLRRRSLTLEGKSAAAAKLIALLSADPLFQNPAFSAPVTRDAHGADIFVLSARVKP